jgi:ABC-2 type transport system permease protein
MPPQIVTVVEYIGANTHFANFSKGVLDTRDIIYFLSLISIFLFSTHLVMQEKN